jgi:hypothetical protein
VGGGGTCTAPRPPVRDVTTPCGTEIRTFCGGWGSPFINDSAGMSSVGGSPACVRALMGVINSGLPPRTRSCPAVPSAQCAPCCPPTGTSALWLVQGGPSPPPTHTSPSKPRHVENQSFSLRVAVGRPAGALRPPLHAGYTSSHGKNTQRSHGGPTAGSHHRLQRHACGGARPERGHKRLDACLRRHLGPGHNVLLARGWRRGWRRG